MRTEKEIKTVLDFLDKVQTSTEEDYWIEALKWVLQDEKESD